MKTAQDSYTITIDQIIRFQDRIHLEKFQVDNIKNGRLSAIIHLPGPAEVAGPLFSQNGSQITYSLKISQPDHFYQSLTTSTLLPPGLPRQA